MCAISARSLANWMPPEAKIRDQDQDPQGTLRVSLPPTIGRAKFLGPLSRLVQRYPHLSLKIDFSEDYIDLRDGSFDLAVRIRPLDQTGIAVEKVGHTAVGIYAAPAYLSQAPTLNTLADLPNHRVIGQTSFFERDLHSLSRRQRRAYADVRPQILANDLSAIQAIVADGLGLGFMPETVLEADLKSGALVKCMVDVPLPPIDLFALFPHGLRGAPRLEAALGALRRA